MLQYFWWSFSHFLQTIRISIRQHLSLPFDTMDRCVSTIECASFPFFWHCSSSFLDVLRHSCLAPILTQLLVRRATMYARCKPAWCMHCVYFRLFFIIAVLTCLLKTSVEKKNRSYCHLHTFVLGCCSCSFKASHFLYLSYMVANCHASLCVRRWR